MIRCHFPGRMAAAALAFAALSACSDSGADTRPAPAQELVVATADFRFRAPKSVPAGLTRIRLRNEGPGFHHVQLVRLEGGHTAADLVEQMAAKNFTPPWAAFVGGPNSPEPGRESEVTLALEPGQYAMVCLISFPDGVPHFAKGMVLPLTVASSPEAARPEPPADVRLVLDDFSFSLTPTLRAGRRTIRVDNAANQLHEVVLVRLAPGKTVDDLLRFFKQPDGPKPGEEAGGTTGMAPGAVNFVTADFSPGEYALLCFMPDATDGKSHVAHGMVRQIRVE